MAILAWTLGGVLLGSWVYCVLIVVAARKYVSVRPSPLTQPEPVSILKPLAGMDEGLADNLRSFFTQKYAGRFEILFAVRKEADAAVEVVRKLQAEFPDVSTRLLVVGEPPYPNAKVWSLDHMMRKASHDLLIMSDSDIRVDPYLVHVIAAEFQDAELGVATCPYRAIGGVSSVWSRLEAVGMNTEFFGGVLVARMLEGNMQFAVGPTIAARRRCLQQIGGFDKLNEFLAEDFVMGKFAAEAGWRVILSAYVVEHRIGAESFAKNAAHRIRWSRSTRRSRPAGYVGQLFTNPLPLALLFVAAAPQVWLALLFTLALRVIAAKAVANAVLRTPVDWPLLLPQDLLSFAFWIAGFFGNTIEWRGIRYKLHSDGRFSRIG